MRPPDIWPYGPTAISADPSRKLLGNSKEVFCPILKVEEVSCLIFEFVSVFYIQRQVFGILRVCLVHENFWF
jgi:hypothetical protein